MTTDKANTTTGGEPTCCPPEPEIIINGHVLSPAAAMTVRVACESFSVHLRGHGLGTDAIGAAISEGYLRRIRKEIRPAMLLSEEGKS